MRYGADTLRIPRIVAITHPENERSIRVLEKLGLQSKGVLVLKGETRPTLLFAPPAETEGRPPLAT